MKRLKEMGYVNEATLQHDGFGNYLNINGVRVYTLTRTLNDGDSSTFGGATAPRGSLVKTTHQNGRGQLFIAGVSTLEAIGGANNDIAGEQAEGTYTFTVPLVADQTRSFNGVVFTAKDAPASAVQFQSDVAVGAATGGDTVLGLQLRDLVAKLNASANVLINIATYSVDDEVGGRANGTKIRIVFDADGVAGNAYTLDTATGRSGATLTGGVAALSEAFLKDPTSLTALAAPANTDLVVVWDTAAGAWKKTTWLQARTSINV